MGYAYLFALILGLGILGVQTVLGIGKDVDADADADGDFDADADADGEFDADADADADFDADADADGDFDADADADAHVHAGFDAHHDVDHDCGPGLNHDAEHHVGADGHTEAEHAKDISAGGSIAALFLSTRFWIFTALGFGLSGTLLHYLSSVSFAPTLATAILTGLVSGLMAALAYRALKRSSGERACHTATAVGQVGKVIVPVKQGGLGKVRIEMSGRSVDLLAKTSELRIDVGDYVVIEDVEGDVAQVCAAPEELKMYRK